MSALHLVVVFLSGAFLAFFYNYFLNFRIAREGFVEFEDEGKEETDLAVCILSARDHFRQRQAIRDTWLSDLTGLTEKRVKVMFVVGQYACVISPADRVDQYSCEEWIPSVPGEADIAVNEMNEEKFSEETSEKTLIHRLALTVLHPVTIKRIGILTQQSNPVQATLWNGVTDEEMMNVVFSSKDPGIEHKGYMYQAIQPLMLPKGFQGEITLNSSEEDINTLLSDRNILQKGIQLNSAGGALLIEGMREDRTYIQMSEKTQPLLSFMFSVEDIPALKDHIVHRKERKSEWTTKIKLEEENLQEESSLHGDILFVNLTDVYRYLPQKLLSCHLWFYSNVAARFVLKTDDDCLVDVRRLTVRLDTWTDTDKLWWGNFRDEWLVERHGKWQEKIFPSSVYPRFACGSGNVVSRDLHKWIALNAHSLQPYQGEDVSLGIWLAATGPHFHQDGAWECSKSCTSGSYVLPELSVEEMRLYWKRKQQCGDLCTDCPSLQHTTDV